MFSMSSVGSDDSAMEKVQSDERRGYCGVVTYRQSGEVLAMVVRD